MCVAMQALEAGQCVELAPGMPTFSAGLAVAPLRVGGGGTRRLWALLPCMPVVRPGWRLQFAARLPAARWACMGRVTALTDDDACVPAYR